MTEKPIIPNQEIPNSRQEKFLSLLILPVPARKQVVLRTKSEIIVEVSRKDISYVIILIPVGIWREILIDKFWLVLIVLI